MGQVLSFPYGTPYEDAIIRQDPIVQLFTDAEVADAVGLTREAIQQRKNDLHMDILSMFEELVSFKDKEMTEYTLRQVINLKDYYNRDWDGAA